MFAVILWVVAVVFHVLPAAALEVSTTLPPWQKVSGPPEMVGAAGMGFTVTAVGADDGLTQPSTVSTTVNEPVVLTVIKGPD